MQESDPSLAETPRYERILGPLLTVVICAFAEVVTHGMRVSRTLSAGVFLLALAPIAYAGLKAGLRAGVLSTLLLALYTLHFVGPHDRLFVATVDAAWAVTIMGGLGLAMSYPMSRIKRREDAMRDALRARARDLEVRNRDLQEANEALEAFGYVVSHDLKEPVRAVENYLDAARQDWPDPESKRSIEAAYRANERLTRLLQGLLNYSRTTSTMATPRPVGLEDVLLGEPCRAHYEAKLAEQGGKLHIEGPLPRVMGDEVILAQLFGNILLNAVRHNTQRIPEVHVRAEHTAGGRVRVHVTDNGPGFPGHVLDRFARLRADRPATIRSGFGLVISYSAARRSEGSMTVANREEGGAVVVLDLPGVESDSVAAKEGG